MASVTAGGPVVYSSKETHDIAGYDPSAWESLTISQILLPVVCAVFISLVVVVIACCLIQRKPKSAGKWRKKSCHTIETSHDTSDIGVYDVIDEMNVSTCSPEKTARQCSQLDSNYILGSHLSRNSKLDNALPSALNGALNYPEEPLKLPSHPQRVKTHTAQVSAYVQKSPDYLEEVNQDDRIYETLDRHAYFRNEDGDHTQFHSIDRSLSFYHRDTSSISRDSLKSYNTYETLNRKPVYEKPCSLCNHQKYKHIKDVHQDLESSTPSLQAEESNKIVCQLSMFKVSETQERTTLIDKAYYRVQSQSTACICTCSEDISTMLHNRNLRLAHQRFRENSPDCGIDHDLILKPVCDADGYVNNIKENNTFAKKLQNILMSQQNPIMVDSQRHNDFPDKRYENLKVSNSDSCTSAIPEQYIHHKGGCNISTSFKCSEVHPRYSDFTRCPEATRISAKLGPLPALPVQYHLLNEMGRSQPSLHQGKDPTFGCCQTDCLTSHTAPSVENILRNQRAISASVHRQFDTAHNTRPKATILNEEVDLITCQLRSVNNWCVSDLRKTGFDIPCVTGTRRTDENTTVDCFNENSNIYFLLEPTSDAASLNGDS